MASDKDLSEQGRREGGPLKRCQHLLKAFIWSKPALKTIPSPSIHSLLRQTFRWRYTPHSNFCTHLMLNHGQSRPHDLTTTTTSHKQTFRRCFKIAKEVGERSNQAKDNKQDKSRVLTIEEYNLEASLRGPQGNWGMCRPTLPGGLEG